MQYLFLVLHVMIWVGVLTLVYAWMGPPLLLSLPAKGIQRSKDSLSEPPSDLECSTFVHAALCGLEADRLANEAVKTEMKRRKGASSRGRGSTQSSLPFDG